MDTSPYNKHNFLVTENDVKDILSNANIHLTSIGNLHFYQKSFVHESYRTLKCYESIPKDESCLPLQKESYERLEFIGDALLESIVANYLYSRYHEIYGQDEGFLTKLKTRLVCGKNLTELSSLLGFQKYIVISKYVEEKHKGRHNMKDHKILCDVFEAFCGALYKATNDYELVKKFVISSIESNIDLGDMIIQDTNYKDQLWRYIKKTYDKYPNINVTEHQNIYETIIFNGPDKIGESSHVDKKQSEQQASKKGLEYYGILN